ncbi:MAG: hypothetical protein HKN94_12845 [Acidimicrobiales bacterium]|nr:hypothetical protein [Acidimicrobiales bacterium]RZV44469.1 MAG: hypothetical protein EX269_11660 [Acidimicrobiales bacterium]
MSGVFFALAVAAAGCADADAGPPEALAFASSRPALTCGESAIVMEFPDSVVLDEDTQSAGPYDITLPAGNYVVRTATWMGPDGGIGSNQQWYFTTDSGYRSPETSDSSPVESSINQFDDQVLGAATAEITIHRVEAAGTIDRVHPLCLGFAPTEP